VFKWDDSIHAYLSAETVPAAETRVDNGFAEYHENTAEKQRTKYMHKNSAAHTSGATLLFATL
jgi:hypothetical protein